MLGNKTDSLLCKEATVTVHHVFTMFLLCRNFNNTDISKSAVMLSRNLKAFM